MRIRIFVSLSAAILVAAMLGPSCKKEKRPVPGASNSFSYTAVPAREERDRVFQRVEVKRDGERFSYKVLEYNPSAHSDYTPTLWILHDGKKLYRFYGDQELTSEESPDDEWLEHLGRAIINPVWERHLEDMQGKIQTERVEEIVVQGEIVKRYKVAMAASTNLLAVLGEDDMVYYDVNQDGLILRAGPMELTKVKLDPEFSPLDFCPPSSDE